LPGTERAQAPFFSADGKWVAFFAQGKLKEVSAQGGPVISVSAAPGAAGGSWGEDGNIVVSLNFRLSRIPSAGGTPARLMELAPGEIAHRWPQILPGGKAVLFSAYTSMTGLDGATVEVLSLREGRRKTLVRGGTFGRYLLSGHLVYIDKGTLFAVPFDLNRLEVHGTPVPVLEDVAYSAAWGSAQIDFSKTGTLVHRSSKAAGGLVTVRWLDESGNEQPLLPVPGNYLSPTLSPDAGRLALTSAGDIWVYELRRGSMTRLTFGGGYGNPLWTPDGHYIVFRAARGILWTRADGTGQPQPLTQSKNQQIAWSFSGDGKRLAFVEVDSATGADIWTLPVETSSSGLRAGKPEVFLQTRFNERGPMFSPDGRWIAYQCDESGTYQVYVQAFPDKHGKRQVSSDRGSQPTWSRDGHELFFRSYGAPGDQLMAASYQERGDSFVADKPRVWSEKEPLTFTSTRSYDPAPDGKRVVALMPAETPEEPPGHLIFLLNFFDELRRRAPLDPP
jgi:serine/threonine-protein kinase